VATTRSRIAAKRRQEARRGSQETCSDAIPRTCLVPFTTPYSRFTDRQGAHHTTFCLGDPFLAAAVFPRLRAPSDARFACAHVAAEEKAGPLPRQEHGVKERGIACGARVWGPPSPLFAPLNNAGSEDHSLPTIHPDSATRPCPPPRSGRVLSYGRVFLYSPLPCQARSSRGHGFLSSRVRRSRSKPKCKFFQVAAGRIKGGAAGQRVGPDYGTQLREEARKAASAM